MSSYNGGNPGMGILGMALMVIGGIVVACLAIGLIGLLLSAVLGLAFVTTSLVLGVATFVAPIVATCLIWGKWSATTGVKVAATVAVWVLFPILLIRL